MFFVIIILKMIHAKSLSFLRKHQERLIKYGGNHDSFLLFELQRQLQRKAQIRIRILTYGQGTGGGFPYSFRSFTNPTVFAGEVMTCYDTATR